MSVYPFMSIQLKQCLRFLPIYYCCLIILVVTQINNSSLSLKKGLEILAIVTSVVVSEIDRC